MLPAMRFPRLKNKAGKVQPTWGSIGTRYAPDVMDSKSRDGYLMWYGKIDVATYYRAAHAQGELFAAALKHTDSMSKHWRRKADEIVLRMHWDPDGYHPRLKGKK